MLGHALQSGDLRFKIQVFEQTRKATNYDMNISECYEA